MEEKISDFLKFAIKHNAIKDVEEAFIAFPVEEEWHKGKVENVLMEEEEDYSFYNVGDIVYVKRYLYNDGTYGENHFFVIVEQNNYAVPIENFGMLISSKIEKLKYKSNIKLEKDELNKLDRDSIVKVDQIYRIDSKQILFKMGEVSIDKVEEYKEKFQKYYKENT